MASERTTHWVERKESGLAMAWSWTSSIPPSPEAPAVARNFVEAAMGSAYVDISIVEETCEDLVVIASELVTNAVQAATSDLRIELEIEPGAVRLAVIDAASGMPTLSGPASFTQPYGRGLAIVAALSQDWGVVPAAAPADGKTVWARLVLVAPPDAS